MSGMSVHELAPELLMPAYVEPAPVHAVRATKPLGGLMMWMVARAHAEEERCLESVVDAVHMAQAIQPAPRESRDAELPDEALVLASCEARLTICTQRADSATRERAGGAGAETPPGGANVERSSRAPARASGP